MTDTDLDTNPRILASMELSYITLLRVPYGPLRVGLQYALCFHRDFIALRTGKSLEDVQNEFEARASTLSVDRLRQLIRLPLLFHAGGMLTKEMQDEWIEITGTPEMTNKVMCDTIRRSEGG